MTETVIFPEMLEAGMLVLKECRNERKTDYETAIAVFLAMRAIEEIACMRVGAGLVH